MGIAVDEAGDRLLFIPVRPGSCGSISVRTGRLASGERIGMAFTSRAAVAATLGAGQDCIAVDGRFVPVLFADAGVAQMRIDPRPAPVPVVVPQSPKSSTSVGPRRRVRSRVRPAVSHAY